MEIQFTRSNTSQPFPYLDVSSAKGFDEIPTFEEAFDPISLRKFFQEHESTNSQSVYSPRKENSLLEDSHSQAADEHEFLFSPLSQFPAQADATPSTADSKANITYTFGLNTKASDAKVATQGTAAKIRRVGPFKIQRVPHTPSSTLQADKITENMQIELQSGSMLTTNEHQTKEVQQINRSLLKSSLRREETKFERMLKDKNVFKVQREEKSKEVSMNIKRRTSSSKEESVPPLKHIKSHPAPESVLTPSKISFDFKLPMRQNSATYPSLQNPFTALENRQTQVMYNPFMSQDQNGITRGTDYLYNIPKH